MKASDLRSKTADEITSAMVEICREQFNLKMQKATGQLSKPDQIKRIAVPLRGYTPFSQKKGLSHECE